MRFSSPRVAAALRFTLATVPAFVGVTAFGPGFGPGFGSGFPHVRLAHADVSDADRAAARELYIEGVKLQEQGKFDAALERFQRAQSVFSAPTHLLHIAECQAALGRLVESTETYRTLVRTPLPPGAPAAFIQAQQQAGAELTQVEPRVPSLKLHVKPDNATNLSVQIDGQPMSAALVGVSRPINPGAHTVSVYAAGFGKAEQQITVKEKEQKDLTLTLQPTSGVVYGPSPTPAPLPSPVTAGPVPPPPPAYGANGPASKAGESQSPEAPAPPVYEAPGQAKKRGGSTSFMFGPRLGVAIPGGNLVQNVSSSDLFGPGGAFGVEVGLRFVRVLYAGLVVDHAVLSKGSAIDAAAGTLATGNSLTTSGSTSYVGLHLAYISNPEGLGFYGELGVGYRWLTRSARVSSADGVSFSDFNETLKGTDYTLGAGVHLKPADWLRIIPKITVSAGTFKTSDQSCTQAGAITCQNGPGTASGDITNTDTHTMVFLGVSGFIDLGRRAP